VLLQCRSGCDSRQYKAEADGKKIPTVSKGCRESTRPDRGFPYPVEAWSPPSSHCRGLPSRVLPPATADVRWLLPLSRPVTLSTFEVLSLWQRQREFIRLIPVRFLTHSRNILRSLISILLGWSFALVVYVALLAVFDRIRDVVAVACWTLIFALAGWVLVGIPLVLFIHARHRAFQSGWGPFIGAALALLTFLALAGRWFPPGSMEFNLFSGFAAVIGGVAWRTYALLGRKSATSN